MLKKIHLLFFLTIALAFCACTAETPGTTDNMPAISTPIETDAHAEVAITESTETTVPTQNIVGSYTLEDCQERGGTSFYVRYSDNSFDQINKGYVLDWGNGAPYTLGTVYRDFHDLIIDASADERNPTITDDNQLVLFCSEDFFVSYRIEAVESSGTTISRINEDGKREAIFFSNSIKDGSLRCDQYWVAGKSIREVDNGTPKIECTYINGFAVGDHPGLPLAEGTWHCNVPEGETYKLGVVEGTTLVEKEYIADARFYIQSDEDEYYEFKMIPTVDGYAIIDLSDIPNGEYILQVYWWDDGNYVATTHITLEH